MPDAMMNGGYTPYLAQAFTQQGVPGGLFGSGMGNVPGTIYSNPTFAQNYGGPPFTVTPQLARPNVQPYTRWQQQLPQDLRVVVIVACRRPGTGAPARRRDRLFLPVSRVMGSDNQKGAHV